MEPTETHKLRYYSLQQLSSQRYETSQQNLGNVTLSNTHKDPAISLDDTQLIARNSQGYRTALATHGISEGLFMYQFTYNFPTENSAFRCGFQPISADLGAPVGFDASSYGIRSIDLSLVNSRLRIPKNNLEQRLTPTGTISCLIYLPHTPQSLPAETEMCFPRNAFSGRKTVENSDSDDSAVQAVEIPIAPVKNSFVKFFLNAEFVGEFTDINFNRFYPAVSGFQFAEIKCNFGLQNCRIPGYPLDWYCLPVCVSLGGEITLYGQNSLNKDCQFGSGEKGAENDKKGVEKQKTFEEFVKLDRERKKECEVIKFECYSGAEIACKGMAFFDEIQSQLEEEIHVFSELYAVRAERDQEAILAEIRQGLYSVDLHEEIGRFLGEKGVKKGSKKVK